MPMHEQWKLRGLLALLIAPVALAAASSAKAQTPPIQLAPGQPFDATDLDNTGGGDVFRAPTTDVTNPAMLNLNGVTITTGPALVGGMAPVVTADSALLVNGGGSGAPNDVNSTPTGITVTSMNSTLTSMGHGVVWLWGPNATITDTGSTFTGNGTPTPFGNPALRAQEATAITVQDGATAMLTDSTLNIGGGPGFLSASKMALCVGGCGETGDPGDNTGGNAMLSNVNINVATDSSAGIWSSRAGTLTYMTGTITLDGANSTGVHADLNAHPMLEDVNITAMGPNSVGLNAAVFATADVSQGMDRENLSNGNIDYDNGIINMVGDGSTAVKASGSYASFGGNTSTITLNQTTIVTMGTASTGLAVCACGGANVNTDATVFGNQPPQVGGTINAMNTNIATMGPQSVGVFAQDATSAIAMGAGADGPQGSGPAGTIMLDNSTVTIMNDGGAGYFANNGTITANTDNVSTTGANSPGGILSNGGTVTVNTGSVTTTGPGSFGFLFQPAESFNDQNPDFNPAFNIPGGPGVSTTNEGATNTLNIADAPVSSAADAFHVTGVPADINITDSIVTGNNGVLLDTEDGGTTNLTDNGSMLTGAILTDSATSTANVSLTDDTWNMSGSSNMTNLNEDDSHINFAPPAAGAPLNDLASYKTLTVTNGTFMGNAGEINMNTFLGDDNSASDRIVINNSTATAATPVSLFFNQFNPAGDTGGGPGALTTMNGIEVVQADENGGTTQDGMFVLDNDELRAGAYTYELFRGGIDGSQPNNWFLRSSFVEEPEPPPPGGNGNGEEPPPPPPPNGGEELPPPAPPPVPEVPGPVFPVEPPPPPGTLPPSPVLPTPEDPHPQPPPVLFPIIGPELATYGVVQPIAREMGLMTLGTLQQRVGDTAPDMVCPPAAPIYTKAPPANGQPANGQNGTMYTKAAPAGCAPAGLSGPAVWGRFYGQLVNNEYQAFADPRANGWMGGFQGGVDLFRGSLWWPGTEVAGVYFSYSTSDINVSGLVTNPQATAYIQSHTGKLGLQAYSAGGYWTHYDPAGWYLDAVLQGTFYTGGASTRFASLPIRGSGFVSSLEGGYPIPMPVFGPGFVLEPQAQIIYQAVSFDNENDGLGPVGLGRTSGATGRLGARGRWTIDDDDGHVWQPYVGTNVWRDWGAQATTTFGIDEVPLNEQATRLEFNSGLTTRINDRLSIYGQAGYQFAVSQTNDGVRRDAVQLDLGAHYRW